MNKYLYILCALTVVGLGLFLATTFKLQPQTRPFISPTQFAMPEDLGKQLAESLAAELKAAPILMLGVTPNQVEDMEVLRGILEYAQSHAELKYDFIAVEPMLPYVELFESNMRIDIKEEMPRFVEGLKNARQQNLRVAIIVPTIYSSQLLTGNPAFRLRQDHALDFFSISLVKFPLTRQQEELFEPACILEQEKNITGTGELGCVIQRLARKTYSMKFEDNKYSGMAEKLSPSDVLVLFNRNAGSR